MSRQLPVKPLVDLRLQMLDPRPNRKSLVFHFDPAFLEHPKGIPGAVADGQNQVFGFDGLAVYQHASKPAVLDGKSGELGFKQHPSPFGDDLLPDGFDHLPQLVGADVGFCLFEGFLGRAVALQPLQHIVA